MTLPPDDIRALVREVVMRTLGQAPAAKRPLLTADEVAALPPGTVHVVLPGTVVTPLARQLAMERRITLETQRPFTVTNPDAQAAPGQTAVARIAIGADHGGYQLKDTLKAMLTSADFGYTVVDCGTNSNDSVDYPDYAYAVARLVANGDAWRGIIIDGAGIGSCMAANKVPGVRAAMCYDQATAVNSREHNNANVLTLGAGMIGVNLAKQITTAWLNTDFGGGRHGRRVDKIMQIEKRFLKK